MARRIAGALVGWSRNRVGESVVYSLRLSRSVAAFEAEDLDDVVVSLNDRQLRAFARDLARAADERGLALAPPRRRLPFI